MFNCHITLCICTNWEVYNCYEFEQIHWIWKWTTDKLLNSAHTGAAAQGRDIGPGKSTKSCNISICTWVMKIHFPSICSRDCNCMEYFLLTLVHNLLWLLGTLKRNNTLLSSMLRYSLIPSKIPSGTQVS